MAPPTEGEASTTAAVEKAASSSVPPRLAASWNEPARLERNCSGGGAGLAEREEEEEEEEEQRKSECAGSALADASTARSATTRDLYIAFELFFPSCPLPGGTYSRIQRSRRTRPVCVCGKSRERKKKRWVRVEREKTLQTRFFFFSPSSSYL